VEVIYLVCCTVSCLHAVVVYNRIWNNAYLVTLWWYRHDCRYYKMVLKRDV
jgi:hypothetical protein